MIAPLIVIQVWSKENIGPLKVQFLMLWDLELTELELWILCSIPYIIIVLKNYVLKNGKHHPKSPKCNNKVVRGQYKGYAIWCNNWELHFYVEGPYGKDH